MTTNGHAGTGWGYAVQGEPPTLLRLALTALRREGRPPVALPGCNGEACAWAKKVADCLRRGDCRGAVLFCEDAGLACCIANKVAAVRAVAVWSVPQAEKAVTSLGANLLVVETAGKTYFEFKQLLWLCAQSPATCPPGVACVLEELDGHAHR